VKYQRSAGEVALALQEKFGYVALGTDDEFAIGELIPEFESVSRTDKSVTGIVTGVTDFADYELQGESLGFDVRDCFDHYFKVEVKKA
jgi:hypothetical protein